MDRSAFMHFVLNLEEETAGRRGPASSPDERDDRIARLEAVLLLSREPLNSRKLSQHASLADGTEARTLVRQLNERYDKVGRSFRVEEVAGGFRLMTRPQFATWLRRLHRVSTEVRLSAPAMETLAVVAYRQPICRADVEAVRGVSCGEILRQLMERELVRITGRSEELGRPYLYGTTKEFLQTFGLRGLEDLPRADALRGVGLPQPELKLSQDTITPEDQEKEKRPVTLSTASELHPEDELENPSVVAPAMVDEDEDYYDDDDDDLDDDLDDDDDDELDEDDDLDEDFDDDEDDLDDFDDEYDDEELDDDDDLDDEDDWEEVDDDWEDEDDDDDDDDDDWEDMED